MIRDLCVCVCEREREREIDKRIDANKVKDATDKPSLVTLYDNVHSVCEFLYTSYVAAFKATCV